MSVPKKKKKKKQTKRKVAARDGDAAVLPAEPNDLPPPQRPPATHAGRRDAMREAMLAEIEVMSIPDSDGEPEPVPVGGPDELRRAG
jgi:hypothetical protein